MGRLRLVAAATLSFFVFAPQTYAAVYMQVSEIPNADARFSFLGDLFADGTEPIDIAADYSAGGLTQSAAGRANYSGVGLSGSQSASFHPQIQFRLFALLRYDELIFSSADGAASIAGSLNLSLDGTHMFTRSSAASAGVAVSVIASSNSSQSSGSYTHSANFFGETDQSSGILSGYSGNGAFDFVAPLSFSTTSPEKIEIRLELLIAAAPGSQSASATGSYLDTLSLNPTKLITFTSGLDATVNAIGGEISNNQLTVVPVPGAGILLLSGLAGVALRGRQRNRTKGGLR